MKNYISSTYTFIAGLTVAAIGSYIALNPSDYLSNLDVTGIASTALTSDLRGMGGMMSFLGMFIFLSTFRKTLRHSALMVSTLIYLAFVVFRTIGFALDGMPGTELIIAYGIECTLVVTGAVIWTKHQGLNQVKDK